MEEWNLDELDGVDYERVALSRLWVAWSLE